MQAIYEPTPMFSPMGAEIAPKDQDRWLAENGGKLPVKTTVSDGYARKRTEELKKMGYEGVYEKKGKTLSMLEEIEKNGGKM
mmetsp:Transcript_92943/g.199329  ORF Transcript_92943/g.199329 Transcript_92943/m.199329 type:complete len:82 (+) Transcript_92943:62-307(+)